MSDAAIREVRVGERNLAVPRFNGFKATVAGEIIATITEKAPDIASEIAAFSRRYESENALRITPAMAKLEQYMRVHVLYDENDEPRLTEEGRVAIERRPVYTTEDFGDVGYVEIPQSPSQYEQFYSVFPTVYRLAKDEVVRLLALVTIANRELEDADEEGVVDETLAKAGRKLLHEADADQILEVFGVALDVLSEQFKNKQGTAGKVVAWISRFMESEAVTPTPTPEPVEPQTPEAPQQEAEIERAQSSQTDSDARTDGPDATLSTERVGAS